MKYFILCIILLVLFQTFLNAEWKLLEKNQQSDRSNVYMDWSSPQYGVIYQLQTDLSATKTFIKVTSDFGKNWSTYSFDSIMVAKNFSPYDRLVQLNYIGTNIFGTTENKKIFLSTDRGITWNLYKPFPTGLTYLRFNKEKTIGLWANIIKSSQPAKCYLIDSTLKIIGTLPTPEELKINSLYYTYFDNNLQYFVSNDGEKNFEFGRIVNGVYNRYPQNFELNSAYFTNPKEGYSYYLNNDQIHLYTTNDSGKTWSNVYSNTIFGNPVIVFGTCKIGYLYNLTGEVESDSLLKTVDGGLNWKKEILPDKGSIYNPIKSLTFFDNCFYLLTKSGLYVENEYSDIAEKSKLNTFQIYPNPMEKNSQFTISFSREIVNIKEVRLYSATGMFIRDLKYHASAGTIFCDLPNDINSGVYLVEIEVNNEETFSKIIIR